MGRVAIIAAALAIGAAHASAAIPSKPRATPTEVSQAKHVLEENGYRDIAVLSTDNQIVTASVQKDGAKNVVDVDPLTGIILPHVELPPIPAQLAPITGLPANPR
ncbi:MAG: PepSY domain-containing protein [Stellaceae bacterium]